MYDVVAYVQHQVTGMEFTYEFQVQYKTQIPGILQAKDLTLLNLIKCEEVRKDAAETILSKLHKAII